MERRVVLAFYFSYIAVITPVLFAPWIIVPSPVGYLMLFGLFLIPLVGDRITRNGENYHIIYLLVTTSYSMLVVIDPVEIGLYGYDPYSYTLTSYQTLFESHSVTHFVDVSSSWPAYYHLLASLDLVTAIDLLMIGKYSPLLIAFIPTFLYLTLCRFTSTKIAFLTGMGFASTRTLLAFESKFIDEFPAIFLLFALILVFSVDEKAKYSKIGQKRKYIIGCILMIAIVLTHHAAALLAISFVFVWTVIVRLINVERLPSRIQPIDDQWSPPLTLTIIGVIGFIGIWIYAAPNFTRIVSVSLLDSVVHVSGGEVSGPSTEPSQPIRSLISTSAMGVFAILACINAYGVLSKKRLSSWAYVWIIYAGMIGCIYSVFLIVGRFVALDPIRFLIVLIPTILAPALAIIGAKIDSTAPQYMKGVSVLIVLSLIITQLAAIPPHVVFSDPSQTEFGEGHYTPAQFSASSWVAEYEEDRGVLAYEHGLWIAKGTENVSNSFVWQCTNQLRVWRAEGFRNYPAREDVLYSAGNIAISKCKSR